MNPILNTSKSMYPFPCQEVCTSLVQETNSPDTIVKNIASTIGPVDVYCWFQGPSGLPKTGAEFMKRSIIQPLLEQKKDATLCLYSLKCWKFDKDISKMKGTIPLIKNKALAWICSSEFFRYCSEPETKKKLAQWISSELPKKEWLYQLSASRRPLDIKVDQLFQNQSSLFDCIKEMDLANAYSLIQYVEGYYLVQRSVKKGLENGQRKIEIAFVLPNDEWKYYKDFPEDIEKILRIDFGRALDGVEVNIAFQFFDYGNSLESRPYLERGTTLKPNQIGRFLS